MTINRRRFIQSAAVMFCAPAIVHAENIMRVVAPKVITGPFYVDYNHNIRYVGAEDATYTVLEFHRYLQDLADREDISGDKYLDITSTNPSLRYTDNYIEVTDGYRVDSNVIQRLTSGTLKTGNAVYSGLYSYGL